MGYQSSKRVHASYVDPSGYLTVDDHHFYRTIVQDQEFYTDTIFTIPVIAELMHQNRLVQTKKSKEEENVLEHEKVFPVNYCTEWCFSMLKDACLQTLKINLVLLESNLELKDCYPWNIVFEKRHPKFVDFTSIVASNEKRLWDPYIQFTSFFYRPLVLASYSRKEFARVGLQNYVSGISTKEFLRYLPLRYFLRHPFQSIGMLMSYFFENYIDSHHETKRKIVNKINQSTMTFTKEQKIRFCKKLIRKTEKIHISTSNIWKKYYKKQDIESDVTADDKIQAIDHICQELDFDTAMDIGCNTGRFSKIVSKYATSVLALDSSEDCVESVYQMSKEQELNILPLVVDYANPPSSYGFGHQTFEPFFSRCSADLVLFLGIMHHIHITCRQSISTMVEHLSTVAKKHLIFEYVDAKDKNNMLISNGRDIHYSRQQVIDELEKYFTVDIQPSDRDTRELFVCTKK